MKRETHSVSLVYRAAACKTRVVVSSVTQTLRHVFPVTTKYPGLKFLFLGTKRITNTTTSIFGIKWQNHWFSPTFHLNSNLKMLVPRKNISNYLSSQCQKNPTLFFTSKIALLTLVKKHRVICCHGLCRTNLQTFVRICTFQLLYILRLQTHI